jgi:Holliday junction resolvase RusA-like endonuclease
VPNNQHESDVSFFVPGIPATQGSHKAFIVKGEGGKPRAAVTAVSGKSLNDWRAMVRLCASQAWSGPPVSCGVRMTLAFRFARPPSVTQRKRPVHSVKPDVDKLTRAVFDALTGVVYHDDSQVCRLDGVDKRYSPTPGLHVSISLDMTGLEDDLPES